MIAKRLALSTAMVLLVLGVTPATADLIVVQNGSQNLLRVTAAGSASTFATANLDSPIGISSDGTDNVYVVNQGASGASTFTNSVAKFSPTGTPLGFFVTPATPPGNTLNAPTDIAFDQHGNAYVTNQTSPNPPYGYIAAYNSGGAFLSDFGTANANLPTGIGFNAFNNLLYVVNSANAGSSGPNLSSFLIYNPASLGSAPTIITPTGAGALDIGQQIAFDPTGNVFIASLTTTGGGSSKIQEYSAAGVYIRTVAATSGLAVGVAYDPTSNTLYASYLSGNIEKYTFNGSSFVDGGSLIGDLNNPQFLLYVPAVAAVPEPSTFLLAGTGAVFALAYARFRNRH